MKDLQTSGRLKLGIVFYFNPSWMGGVNYIINVVRMLNFLDDKDKPEITLFYSPELKKFIDDIYYPYLKSVERQFPSVLNGYLRSWISGKNVFVNDILIDYDLDGLYPIHDFPVRTTSKTKLVSWYADLQHKYYPDFFTKLKIFERNARIKLILRNSDDLVVSSLTVSDDFSRFFRIRPAMKIHLFHFCSVIDDLTSISIEELLVKYELTSKYFIVSNQFYKHKNHKILLNALADLKRKGVFIQLALTGKLPENDVSPYIKELNEIIFKNQLQNQIRFLGVLPRKEQLLLMKYSQAVIQPTLFEGWSTVIEDAISLQVPVVASNLPVNIEQLGKDGVYFDPNNPSELASILIDYPRRNLEDIFYEPYSSRIKKAAMEFIKIFS
jgi:glycosyltransferase involved in cell wall biosynthesis